MASIWKIKKRSGKTIKELDIKQLRCRLLQLLQYDNTEVLHLALQSIVDELNE
jgi:hypothetical protein